MGGNFDNFDVVVIGGGHAGCEAAHAAAKMGCRTALLTLDVNRIAAMSCNPAIGGLAKGQLVKEIDALGGLMGVNTDKTAIQYRRLNASKGPAVRSSRAQCDKGLYASRMQERLAGVAGLTIIEGEAWRLDETGGRIAGVVLRDGSRLGCKTAVVTAGTFLRGILYTGFEATPGGRAGDRAAEGLSESLQQLGFQLGRLKTGTPPRLNKKTIKYDKLEEQPGDPVPLPFSFYFRPKAFPVLPQISCHITYTNELTHRIIEENFDRSPMFTGMIQGLGPRYCPSIEDKVKRFRSRERHQLFLEPEGLDTDWVYVNGISTSLPQDVQEKFVRSIDGLDSAEFFRFGYAVEYDCIDARVLRRSLEAKDLGGLFFAGQINGTSGYEEAAAQGLIAGINAAREVKGEGPFTIAREDGYIGVMVDDLVTKGADEPYRMFTSRAEYRLLLREDNADLRLSQVGFELGLLGQADYEGFRRKSEAIERGRAALSAFFVMPTGAVNEWLARRGQRELKDRVPGDVFLRRPEVSWADLGELGFEGSWVAPEVAEQIEIQTKYEGYIRRELELLSSVRKSEDVRVPPDLDFDSVAGLSNEVRSRLKKVRPESLGQVSRMAGITPAAVANLLIHLKMSEREHD